MASVLFDKYCARFNANPPVMRVGDLPLTSTQARGLALQYASGLSLTPDEI